MEKALQRGVTRDVAVGQGNGMAGSMTILNKMVANYLFGLVMLYSVWKEAKKGTETGPDIPGTGVLLSLI